MTTKPERVLSMTWQEIDSILSTHSQWSKWVGASFSRFRDITSWFNWVIIFKETLILLSTLLSESVGWNLRPLANWRLDSMRCRNPVCFLARIEASCQRMQEYSSCSSENSQTCQYTHRKTYQKSSYTVLAKNRTIFSNYCRRTCHVNFSVLIATKITLKSQAFTFYCIRGLLNTWKDNRTKRNPVLHSKLRHNEEALMFQGMLGTRCRTFGRTSDQFDVLRRPKSKISIIRINEIQTIEAIQEDDILEIGKTTQNLHQR